MSEARDVPRVGRVTNVVNQSRKGPYTVLRVPGFHDESVTFDHTDPDVWQEEHPPAHNNTVVISDIRHTPKGWRAYKAHFYRPEDEKHVSEKESEAAMR